MRLVREKHRSRLEGLPVLRPDYRVKRLNPAPPRFTILTHGSGFTLRRDAGVSSPIQLYQ
jgi:hypothetical protein